MRDSEMVQQTARQETDGSVNLTPDQLDALKELINIGVGRAAATLNAMIQVHIQLQVPFIQIVALSALEEMTDLSDERLAAVRLAFQGPFSGTAALVFPTESAAHLVSVLTGEEADSPDLDAVRVGTLTEVGNIVLNGVMGSMGNVLERRIDYVVPSYMEATITNLLTAHETDPDVTVLLAQTRFTIEQLHIHGDVMLFFEVGSFDALVEAIDAMLA